MTHVHSGECYE